MVTGSDSGNSCSIALPYKFGKLSRFDNTEKFMSMGGSWQLRGDPSNWRPYVVKELYYQILECQVWITWPKPTFLSILRSWDFNFNIGGTFLIWLKFNLASHSVGGIPFFWLLLVRVVLMTLSFTTSLFPGTPHFSRTLAQAFSWGTSVSWLREILGNFLKQCHYMVTLVTFPGRAWTCCFVHLTCPRT